MAPQQLQPRLHNEVYPFISPEKFSKSLDSQVVVITGKRGAIVDTKRWLKYLLDYNTEPLAELEKTCLHLGAKATFSGKIDVASYEICKDVVERVSMAAEACDICIR